MTWLKRLLMVFGALWLISIFAGAVILWGNDWRLGAGCLVAGAALIGSAIYSRTRGGPSQASRTDRPDPTERIPAR
jgi:hypothetical protein